MGHYDGYLSEKCILHALRYNISEHSVLVAVGREERRKDVPVIDQFHPATPYEQDLVETMTVNRWRLRRIWALESASFGHEQRAQAFATQGEDPPTKYALAHRALSQPPRSVESLNRYEVRCDRQYNRAADRLRRLLAERLERERAKTGENEHESAKTEEKEKMRNRSQLIEQNQPLNPNDPPQRTGVEPGDEPGSNQGSKPMRTQALIHNRGRDHLD